MRLRRLHYSKATFNRRQTLLEKMRYSGAPNNRADPNKRGGRKFQSLLIVVKDQMDTYCCSEY